MSYQPAHSSCGSESFPTESTTAALASSLIGLARPKHWIKNIIVLLPVVFAKRILDPTAWFSASFAALAFCFASSAIYVTNDILDRDKDRRHPRKKKRPVAAGKISPELAGMESVICGILAMVVAVFASQLVIGVIITYLLLQLMYSCWLRQKVIIDVICISLGFVLRAVAGAVAIRVAVSHWLVVCTFTICLFMGFCKRRNELATIENQEAARKHRETLSGYTTEFLTHLITLTAGIAVLSYLLYACSPRTIRYFGTPYLVYTLPFVVYGICRFAMVSIHARYNDPTELILKDRPFQFTLILWFVSAVFVIFWGPWLKALISAWY